MNKFLIAFLILFIHSQLLANDNSNPKVTNSIADQLKTLQDLYKSGVLSGYEYETEKKKILDK
tara:strand:+ start:62 stop:250 length:189 start_codon:yes stop_codon:yes gene_type:complete